MFRRGLDQCDRVRDYPRYRGESSHYIVPGRVPMSDRKVLYAMRCMCYMLLCDMYVMYDKDRKSR